MFHLLKFGSYDCMSNPELPETAHCCHFSFRCRESCKKQQKGSRILFNGKGGNVMIVCPKSPALCFGLIVIPIAAIVKAAMGQKKKALFNSKRQ